jgi:PfaD family protein
MSLTLTTSHFPETQRPAAFAADEIADFLQYIRQPAYIIQHPEQPRLGLGLNQTVITESPGGMYGIYPLVATLPPLYPEWLGDRSFLEAHRVRFPYVAGDQAPVWGSNLIHSPDMSGLEDAVVDLYLRCGVRRVSASAFMELSPAIVRYAASGLMLNPAGQIERKNHVFAKISRPEVARHFMQPAPPEILAALVGAGHITDEEARLAAWVPVAEDITAESDSGGHTDNRPLTVLYPLIAALRDETMARYRYARPIRVGAAGGLGHPQAVAAAFALGAAYVLVGSVNQSAVESGLAQSGRRMLAQAGMADVIMAPAADMFEMGVKVQVLKRGTMFGVRGLRLYELYTRYNSLEDIPAIERARLEKEIFQKSLEEVWNDTRAYFERVDPSEAERAGRDSRHRMALVFRWYLGQSSRWAISGEPSRMLDAQIWCGPAMGAFNEWVAGSFLEASENRGVVQIARNLLEGAAVVTRAGQARSYGLPVPAHAFDFRPRPLQ